MKKSKQNKLKSWCEWGENIKNLSLSSSKHLMFQVCIIVDYWHITKWIENWTQKRINMHVAWSTLLTKYQSEGKEPFTFSPLMTPVPVKTKSISTNSRYAYWQSYCLSTPWEYFTQWKGENIYSVNKTNKNKTRISVVANFWGFCFSIIYYWYCRWWIKYE